jgi:hypothetical protein
VYKYQVINAETGEVLLDNLPDGKVAKESLATAGFTCKTRIVRVKSEEPVEDTSWHQREADRFDSGDYTPLPEIITNTTWWYDRSPELRLHFARMSKEKDTMVAFVPDAEYGRAERYLRMPPARYLSRFFGHVLPSHVIRDLATAMEPPGAHKLVLSYKREDFVKAYEGQHLCADGGGYRSCMSHNRRQWGVSEHPAAAYSTFQGDYDPPNAPQDALAIAYILNPDDSDEVLSRSLVIPHKRRFVRIYARPSPHSDNSSVEYARLQGMLMNAGFSRYADLDGMRLAIVDIENKNHVLMPYIDGDTKDVYRATDNTNTLVVGEEHSCTGRHLCTAESTSGYVYSDGGDADDRFICDNCRDDANQDDAHEVHNHGVWCRGCVRHDAFLCGYYDEYYATDDGCETVRISTRSTITQTWSERAVEHHAFYCDYTEQYYSDSVFTMIAVYHDVGHPSWSETWCLEATTDSHFQCADCEEYFHNDFKSKHTNADGQTVCLGCGKEHETTPEVGLIADERQQVIGLDWSELPNERQQETSV